MNQALPNKLLDRVRRTWGRLYPVPDREDRRIDRLVKMNLPPLMGRRDAAYDRTAELLKTDFFTLDETARSRLCRDLTGLLRCAAEYTQRLRHMMTSSDTIRREENILAYLAMLENCVGTLRNFIELELQFLDSGSGLVNREDFDSNEEVLTSTEMNLVSQLHQIFDRNDPRIRRYRGYAVKNLSGENAARYRNAYEISAGVYAEDSRSENNVCNDQTI